MLPVAAGTTRENQPAFDIQTLDWFIQQEEGAATRLKSYEILWISRGKGQLTVDLYDLELSQDKVYLFRPGQFRYLGAAQDLEGYYLSVSPDFFHLSGPDAGFSFLQTYYKGNEGPVVIQTNEEMQQESEEILVKLRREFTHYAATRSGILKGLFKIFMLYLAQQQADAPAQEVHCTDKELVNRFMESVKAHFMRMKLVADYAGALCITPGHLNRIVKKISGFPASHHIQQQIILEAKRQAVYSNRSMKEIAYLLGFDDTTHFSKFFKNNSGMNFSSFKKTAYM